MKDQAASVLNLSLGTKKSNLVETGSMRVEGLRMVVANDRERE